MGIKRILVIRPDAIGDVVLTLPAISALKKRFPEAQISVLVKEYTAPLFKNSPDVSEVLFDEGFQILSRIKERKFDLVIHYYNELPYVLLGLLAGISDRLGDSSRVLIGWMNNLKVFRKWGDFTRHEVEFNLDLLEPLDIKDKNPSFNLIPHPEALEDIDEILSQNRINKNDLLIGVHVSAGKNNKSWTTLDLAETINWLVENKRAQAVITGGPEDIERGEKITLLCREKPLNLVGKLSLEQLVALTSRYKFYLGMDTGPTHIAAALGIPLVVLYLSKRAKPLRWGPWGTRHLVVKKPSKCTRVCFPFDCKDSTCSEEITFQEAIEACEEVLRGGGVKTQEEAFDHWLKKSLSILITSHPKNNRQAMAIQKLLVEAGYHALVFNPPRSIKKLLNYLIQKDISIIHSIDNFRNYQILIAGLLSGSYLSNRTLWVKTKNREFNSSQELISLYLNKFKTAK